MRGDETREVRVGFGPTSFGSPRIQGPRHGGARPVVGGGGARGRGLRPLGRSGEVVAALDAHTEGAPAQCGCARAHRLPAKEGACVGARFLVAWLRDANVTGPGAWSCTLELPALFEPGDNHSYLLTLEARTKQEVVQDLLCQLSTSKCMCMCMYIFMYTRIYTLICVCPYVQM